MSDEKILTREAFEALTYDLRCDSLIAQEQALDDHDAALRELVQSLAEKIYYDMTHLAADRTARCDDCEGLQEGPDGLDFHEPECPIGNLLARAKRVTTP
jgi:hypothetical protein